MKILICDDHKIVRDGLVQILKQMLGVSLIKQAGTGAEALAILEETVFDIVLLDITLPGISGLEVLKSIKERWPATNVLMLSMLTQEQYVIRALKFGASGYLSKDTASDELLMAVQKVSAGGKYISPVLAENIALNFDRETSKLSHELLSPREFEILIKLANGMGLSEIGQELFISNKTVSTYRSRIMEKMNFSKNTVLNISNKNNTMIYIGGLKSTP